MCGAISALHFHEECATAIPERRGQPLVFSTSNFKDWMDNASKAHREYTGGKINSSEFLRRIDTWQELSNYDVKAKPLVWMRPFDSSV